MKKSFTMIIAVLLIGLTLMPRGDILHVFAKDDKNYYVNGVDFSNLTPSREAYIDGPSHDWSCVVDTNSEIFTKGIWTDKASEIGIGKTNFHGFYANDTNADGKTDNLEAYPYNNAGMRFTLGLNSGNDFSSAKAVAVHIDNSKSTVWGDQTWLSVTAALIDKNNKRYSLKPPSQNVGKDIVYIQLDTEDIYRRDISVYGYGCRGNKDGWYLIPLTAFEQGFNMNDITQINLDSSSTWSANMTICDVGFVTDINGFANQLTDYLSKFKLTMPKFQNGTATATVNGNETQIVKAGQKVTVNIKPDPGYEVSKFSVTGEDGTEIPVIGTTFEMPLKNVTIDIGMKKSSKAPPDGVKMYGSVWNITGITIGDYRDSASKRDGIVDTGSELYTKNVVIDNEKLGLGKDKTNFHGFRAEDMDNDGVVDRLRSHPYNDNGMRFTLGLNNIKAMPEQSQAVLIKIDNTQSDGSWNDNTLQEIGLTLLDKNKTKYSLKKGNAAENIKLYFISDNDYSVKEYNASDGYSIIPGKGSGWAVIPLDAFENYSQNSELAAISFDISSTANVFTSLYEMGFTSDMKEMINILSGNPTSYNVSTSPTDNGTVSISANAAVAGEKISFTVAPKDGYLFDKAVVKGKTSNREDIISKKEFIMPNEDVIISIEFIKNPYETAKRVEQVFNVVQNFDVQEKNYFDWDKGHDFSELIEHGVMVKNEKNGFRATVDNSYNLNGISIQKDIKGQKGMQLWSHDNLGMSVTLKANKAIKQTDYQGLVIRINNQGSNEISFKEGPNFSVVLYGNDKDGNVLLDAPIKIKESSELYGVTVYLIDAETGDIIEKPLGYSPENASGMTESEKYDSTLFLPDVFDGYLVIPMNYFESTISANDVSAVQLNYDRSYWYYYSTIYNIGFTPSIKDFLRVASLVDLDLQQEYESPEVIDKSVFETYKDSNQNIVVTVNKDLTLFYQWSFNGRGIHSVIDFNPRIDRLTDEQSGLYNFYSNPEETFIYNVHAERFPGEAFVSFDVGWDFVDGTALQLCEYNLKTGELTSIGKTASVKNGMVRYSINSNGYYALTTGALSVITEAPKNDTSKPEDETTKIYKSDTYTVVEKRGHEETTPGKERYKIVSTIHFNGYSTWFIVLIVGISVVLAAGAVTLFFVIKKKRGGRKNV